MPTAATPPAVLARIRRWLDARTPRERALLKGTAIVAPLAAILALLDWTLAEQTRLSQRLPAAQAAFERMQEDAAELARLRALSNGASTGSAAHGLAAAATAAARARGLALAVEARGEELQAEGRAPLAALVDWLAAVQAELHLRPLRLTIDEAAGHVEIVLARPDADER